MAENVQIAMITLFAGVFGSLFGFLGGVLSAKINANAQVRQTVMQEQFKIRSELYQQVFHAHIAMAADSYSEQNYGAFLKAINSACIVSSGATSAQLMIWQDLVQKDPSGDPAKAAMTSALIAMQHDLENFTAPRILKNKWPKKQRVQLDMLGESRSANNKEV